MARLLPLTPGRPRNVGPAAAPAYSVTPPPTPGPTWQIVAALAAQRAVGYSSVGFVGVKTDSEAYTTDSEPLTTDTE